MLNVNLSMPTANEKMIHIDFFVKAFENFNEIHFRLKQAVRVLQEQEERIKKLETRLSKVEHESLEQKRRGENLERETNKRFKLFESTNADVQQRIDSYLSAKSDQKTRSNQKMKGLCEPFFN